MVDERYHAPLPAAYTKLRADLDRATSYYECLQMAVFAIKNAIVPEGFCPTLLVFGAIPSLARRNPSLIQLARAKAIDNGIHEAEKLHMKKKISIGLNHNQSPEGSKDTNHLQRLPEGSKVPLYRTTSQA